MFQVFYLIIVFYFDIFDTFVMFGVFFNFIVFDFIQYFVREVVCWVYVI